MTMHYILIGHEPQPCDDLVTWAQFLADIDARTVKKSDLDGYHVSTVFLGIDHGMRSARPVLFETQVFNVRGRPVDVLMRRASTWAEALQNHAVAEDEVREVVEIDGPSL